MSDPSTPPGPWHWERVAPPPSDLVKPEAQGALHGDALVAADGTWLVSAESGYATLDVHPAVRDLLAQAWQVADLRRQLAQARAWAWSEFHRTYDERWLPTVEAPHLNPPWDWDVPEWLTSVVEPVDQDWWVSDE